MAIRKEYNQSWNPFWLNMPDSGTKDYEDLENLPEINNTEIKGDKTGADYGLGDVNQADIAPEFSAETAYSKDDIVYYDGALYKFTADHAAGAWTGEDVSATKISENLGGEEYVLPTASDETLGGVKVGYGLSIDAGGVLSEEDMAVRRYQFMRNYGGNTGTHYAPNSGGLDLTVNQYFNAERPLFFQFEFTGTPVTGDTDRDLAALNGTFFLTMSELQSAKTVENTYRTIKKKVFMGVYGTKEIWAMVNLEVKYDPYVSEDGIWPSYKFNSASMDIMAADGSDLPEAYVSVYLWVRGSKTKVG